MRGGIRARAALVFGVDERRRHRRVDLRFPVKFRILSDDEALDHLNELERRNLEFSGACTKDQGAGIVQAENVSVGGLGLRGELGSLPGIPPEEGTFLDIKLELPSLNRTLSVIGIVMWVAVDREDNIFRMGVSFAGIDQRNIREIEDLVQETRGKGNFG